MNPQSLEYISDRQIDAKIVREGNDLPFSDYLPDTIASPFEYEVAQTKDIIFNEQSLREFDIEETETVLNGEAGDSEVIAFYTDLFPSEDQVFSAYGEVDRSSDFFINSAVFLPGQGRIDDARQEFRDYALPTEKDEHSEYQNI